MKAHIILAHPERQSFNGQLADLSARMLGSDGAEATLSDLYGMGFDPCEGPAHFGARAEADVFHAQTEQRHAADRDALPEDVEAEIARILACDLLVVHFPLWWFGMPAILKGWMDRVFVYGRMYRSQMRYDQGICAGKRMIACVTTGTSADSCAPDGGEGDTQMHLWPLLFPFRYLGFEVLAPQVFHGVGGVAFIEGDEGGLSTVDAYRAEWEETLANLSARASVPYNRDQDFDPVTKRLRPGAPSHSPFVRQMTERD